MLATWRWRSWTAGSCSFNRSATWVNSCTRTLTAACFCSHAACCLVSSANLVVPACHSWYAVWCCWAHTVSSFSSAKRLICGARSLSSTCCVSQETNAAWSSAKRRSAVNWACNWSAAFCAVVTCSVTALSSAFFSVSRSPTATCHWSSSSWPLTPSTWPIRTLS